MRREPSSPLSLARLLITKSGHYNHGANTCNIILLVALANTASGVLELCSYQPGTDSSVGGGRTDLCFGDDM